MFPRMASLLEAMEAMPGPRRLATKVPRAAPRHTTAPLPSSPRPNAPPLTRPARPVPLRPVGRRRRDARARRLVVLHLLHPAEARVQQGAPVHLVHPAVLLHGAAQHVAAAAAVAHAHVRVDGEDHARDLHPPVPHLDEDHRRQRIAQAPDGPPPPPTSPGAPPSHTPRARRSPPRVFPRL